MEVTFNNKSNILEAQLLTTHDSSPIYTLTTEQTLFGRTYTYLRDVNPVLDTPQLGSGFSVIGYGPRRGGTRVSGGGKNQGTIVGMINWKKKTMDVGGQRKKLGDVRRKMPGFVRRKGKTRLWRWAPDREEYRIEHEDEGWKVTSTTTSTTVGTLSVPYRPKLFGHTKPVVLKLSRSSLIKDEVFLILALIYSEAKRGDGMNGSGTWGF